MNCNTYIRYVEEIKKQANIKDCKYCKHFQLSENKPVCTSRHFAVENCTLITKLLG